MNEPTPLHEPIPPPLERPYTDAELRASMDERDFARYQQQRFLMMVVAQPRFHHVLQAAVVRFLRSQGDKQLRKAADAIANGELDVADEISQSHLREAPARPGPRGARRG